MKENGKKRLSYEAKSLIEETTEDILKKKLNILDEELPKIVINNLLSVKQQTLKERQNVTDSILKKYIPLKQQIDNINKTFLSNENLKDLNEKFVSNLMTETYKDVESKEYKEIKEKRDQLVRLFNFIDNAIQEEKTWINQKIDELINCNSKNKNQLTENEIDKLKGRLFILENYYEKGVSVRKIKDDFYINEKRYSYDKKDLLNDMYERLELLHSTINYMF